MKLQNSNGKLTIFIVIDRIFSNETRTNILLKVIIIRVLNVAMKVKYFCLVK